MSPELTAPAEAGSAPAAADAPAAPTPTATRHHEVLIIGGGTAGISVAARLRKADRDLDVAVLEPSPVHYYQPLWTLVGGGAATREETARDQAKVIPRGVTWVQAAATRIDPDARVVETSAGETIRYDQLVVSPGLVLQWDRVEGLAGNVGKNGVCSNYSVDTVDYTWEAIQATTSGRALFTHPNTPIKCGGAPQKIMYLACDHWRKTGVLKDIQVEFHIASPKIFAVERYAKTLLEVCDEFGVEVCYRHDLVALDAAAKTATFAHLDTGEQVTRDYAMIHVTPPMGPPPVVAESPLAAETGWVEVHKHFCQHVRYPDVFALGDASNLPTSKTGAAIRKQAPVVARNLLALRADAPLPASYDGYTSCPLVTGYGKLVLAEFDYDKQPQETFPIDQSRQRWSMYQLKRHLLPLLYWHGMLKGRA